MTHFKVTHSAFRDTFAKVDIKAGSLIVNGAERATDMVARFKACGASDVVAVELTPAEHAAERATRMPVRK